MAKPKENFTVHQNKQAAQLLCPITNGFPGKTAHHHLFSDPAAERLSPALLGMADWAIKISDQFQNLTVVE